MFLRGISETERGKKRGRERVEGRKVKEGKKIKETRGEAKDGEEGRRV